MVAEFGGDDIVGGDIDNGGEYAAMRVAAHGVQHPILAPAGLELQFAVAEFHDFKAEPAVERPHCQPQFHAFLGQFFCCHAGSRSSDACVVIVALL